MFGLKRLFSRDGSAPALSPAVQSALEAWRQRPEASRDDLHFHTRYVVVDVSVGGRDPESDPVLGIAAVTIHHGVVSGGDACFVDLSLTDQDAIAEQLAGFLAFVDHDPLVIFNEVFVATALQRIFRAGLGERFEPDWIDLAWLLPAMFEERCDTVAPLDFWLDAFALESAGERRDPMANTLMVAKVFQQLLVRAVERNVDTAARLLEECRASRHLLRSF